jgi:hypothetical protein
VESSIDVLSHGSFFQAECQTLGDSPRAWRAHKRRSSTNQFGARCTASTSTGFVTCPDQDNLGNHACAEADLAELSIGMTFTSSIPGSSPITLAPKCFKLGNAAIGPKSRPSRANQQASLRLMLHRGKNVPPDLSARGEPPMTARALTGNRKNAGAVESPAPLRLLRCRIDENLHSPKPTHTHLPFIGLP